MAVYVRSEAGDAMYFGPNCSIALDGFQVLAVGPSGWSLVLEKKQDKETARIARDEWVFAVANSDDQSQIYRDSDGDLCNSGRFPMPETIKKSWA